MITFIRNPVSHTKLHSAQVRKKWDNHKYLLRLIFAAGTTLVILIGMELSTPEYSLSTTVVAEVLMQSDILNSIIENNWLRHFFFEGIDPENSIPIPSGSNLKFAFFFVIFAVLVFLFVTNDPLSNSKLLRKVNSETCALPLFCRWMREITYYAHQLPSNRLSERCAACTTQGCGNRLATGEDRCTYAWNSLFAKLPPSFVNELLFATHRCRYIFFLKYGVLLAIAVLIPTYFSVRAYEYYSVGTVNINYGLILWVMFLLIFGNLIGRMNSVKTENALGVWGQFTEKINNLFYSPEFKQEFHTYVCQYDNKSHKFVEKDSFHREISPGHELQRLITLVNYLDDIVKQKILRSFKSDYSVGDVNSLRALLVALVEMLLAINYNEINFRCALFVEEKEKQLLIPLVTVPYEEQPFNTLESNALMRKLALD